MAKLSDLDKAIDQLEQEAQILYLAIAKLKEQRAAKPARMKPLFLPGSERAVGA